MTEEQFVIRWIPIYQARKFIKRHHRHAPHLTGAIVALGLWVGDELRGVATIGRGARMDRDDTAVITRLCTDGCRNGCSALYAKAKRLAQALGFVGIKTFTRGEEPGASLFAAGAELDGETKAQHWSRSRRPRSTEDATVKRRWVFGREKEEGDDRKSGRQDNYERSMRELQGDRQRHHRPG